MQIALVLLLCVCLVQQSLGYSYFLLDIAPQTVRCFHENLKRGDRLDLSFQVAEGGNLDIDFSIAAPDARVIYAVQRQSTNTFGFNADVDGKHQYCFNNKISSFASKQVSFTVMGPDERAHQEQKSKNADPKHEALEKEINALSDGLRAMKDEQAYMVVREATHRMTAKSTKSRIVWWSLLETVVLIGVCLFQVYYLKRFFEVKRGI
ncbi:MAG: hypothetical protein SGCHY_003588 [Lobulomycetales sp.]